MKKFSVYIEGFGWTVMESDTELALQVFLSKKYPGKNVIVRPVKVSQLSDTEIAAQEEE